MHSNLLVKFLLNPQNISIGLIVLIEWFFINQANSMAAVETADMSAALLWWTCAAVFPVYVALTSINRLHTGVYTYAWFLDASLVAAFVNSNTASTKMHQDERRTITQCGAYRGLFWFLPIVVLLRPIFFPRWMDIVVSIPLRKTGAMAHETDTTGQVPADLDTTMIVTAGPDPRALFSTVPELGKYHDLTVRCQVKDKYYREKEESPENQAHTFPASLATQILLTAFEETVRSKIAEVVASSFSFDHTGDYTEQSGNDVQLFRLEANRQKLEMLTFRALTESGNILLDAGIVCRSWEALVLRRANGRIREIHFPGRSVLSIDLKVEDQDWPDTLERAGSVVAEATQEAKADVKRRTAVGVGNRKAIQAMANLRGISEADAAELHTVTQIPRLSLFNLGGEIKNAILGGRRRVR